MLCALTVLAGLLVAAQQGATYTVSLQLKGPNCEGCKQDIERGLKRLRGCVTVEAKVDVAKRTGSAVALMREGTRLHRLSIDRTLRQFTVGVVLVAMRGDVTSIQGATVTFTPKGGKQRLTLAAGRSKAEADRFQQLCKAGKGSYEIQAELAPLPGGEQLLRLRNFKKKP